MEQCLIISGASGIGKTTLAERYSNDIFDLEPSQYEYIEYDNSANGNQEIAISNRYQNREWPTNYLNEIMKSANQYGVVLITDDIVIRKVLQSRNIPYVACFREGITDDSLNKESRKLILSEDEYLEDALQRVGVIQQRARVRK